MGELTGQTISHFKIGEKLGQGGMGVVYRGLDLNLDRPVAIKLLPPEAEQDEEAIGRFLREAKLASRLQHPAITTIYEFGIWEKSRYLVMELIEGKTLKQFVLGRPLAVEKLLDIGCQVVDALCLAHEKGIIHRDLKAENIMVTERGQVKILDFGLAKMVGSSQAKGGAQATFQTSLGTVVGTVSHMSPEQVLGVELDGRTDVYSFGVVLYEMATGEIPFTGPSASVVLAKVLNAPPPPFAPVGPAIPKPLELVILKCLEKNRDHRYANAQALLEQLRNLQRQPGLVPEPQKVDLAQLLPTASFTAPAAEAAPAASPVSSAPTVAMPAAAAPAAPAAQSSSAVQPATPPKSGATSKVFSDPAVRRKRMLYSGLYGLVGVVRGLLYATVKAFALACAALVVLPFLPLKEPYPASLLMILNTVHRFVDPLYGSVAGLMSRDVRVGKVDLLLLGMIVVVSALGSTLEYPLRRAQENLKKRMRGKKPGERARIPVPAPQYKPTSDRKALLREYAAFQQVLMEAQKDLAFLSVDVVGSTKMKAGEDKLVVEHAFSEYKDFAEEIFQRHGVWKATWTPDGVMTCFFKPEEAVEAAQELLTRLTWFNANAHRMKGKFQIRCGIHCGKVTIADSKPLEEVSDEVIDVTGHMQKYADADSVFVSEETFNRLTQRQGFQAHSKQVDNHGVYVWSPPKKA